MKILSTTFSSLFHLLNILTGNKRAIKHSISHKHPFALQYQLLETHRANFPCTRVDGSSSRKEMREKKGLEIISSVSSVLSAKLLNSAKMISKVNRPDLGVNRTRFLWKIVRQILAEQSRLDHFRFYFLIGREFGWKFFQTDKNVWSGNHFQVFLQTSFSWGNFFRIGRRCTSRV